jgi:hypothetical protein
VSGIGVTESHGEDDKKNDDKSLRQTAAAQGAWQRHGVFAAAALHRAEKNAFHEYPNCS